MFVSEAKKAPSRSRRGVALILVLAIIVLITGLVVAFFSSVTTELVSEKSYAGGGASRQMADAATQLVIGTIRKATSETSGPGNPSGTDMAWASQPGMIRTWDSRGTPHKCYKLFSSNSLEADPPYDPTTEIDPKFDTFPALYTDLNAPVTLPKDPDPQGTNPSDPANPSDPYHTLHYPIIDPSSFQGSGANGVSQIQGFSIDNTRIPATTVVPNTAPMPVRWIYVLQDGSLIAPTSGNSSSNGTTATADFTGAPNPPTAANPIVGRIAYWTDDETCKVNLNTASEGVYWDVPHIATREDVGVWNGNGPKPNIAGLSLCQPAIGEYQRFPGHPATTCLSPVFGNLSPLANPDAMPFAVPGPGTTITTTNNGPFQTYYDLLPRVSQEGLNSVKAGSQSGTMIPNTNPKTNAVLGRVYPDTDRLFASVDELIFKSGARANKDSDTNRKVYMNPAATPSVPVFDKVMLEKAKFFLTTHSSAPEVTMFNTPRVSMWPVWNDSSQQTVLDKTLAFCATTGQPNISSSLYPYYFTRTNSRSTSTDYTSSPRNQNLYRYLQQLMSMPEPGFGGSFYSKYNIDSYQILTSIYDYIRCINMYDITPPESGGVSPPKPYTNVNVVRIGTATNNQSTWKGGEILPIHIPADPTTGRPETQGYGRTMTLSGIDLIFCGIPNPAATDKKKAARVQVLLVPSFFCPMQGLPAMFPRLKYTITGQKQFRLNGKAIFKQVPDGQSEGTNWIVNAPIQANFGRGWGGLISPRASIDRFGAFLGQDEKDIEAGADTAPVDPPDTAKSGSYPFVSYNPNDTFSDVSADGSPKISPNIPLGNDPANPPATMDFVGGQLTVKLYAADDATNTTPLQTFFVYVPSATGWPTPAVVQPATAGADVPALFGTTTKPGLGPPAPAVGFTPGRTSFVAEDVIRGVEMAGPGDPDPTALPAATDPNSTNNSAGDGRMIAVRSIVPASFYHAHKDWASTGSRTASGLMDDDGTNSSTVGNHGSLVSGISPRNNTGNLPAYRTKNPYVPSRVRGVTRPGATVPGDWDAGFAMLPDGAFLNMGDIGDQAYVDEAATNADNATNGQFRYPYLTKEDHYNTARGAGAYFSPNRQVPSSMVLGSIPTGALANQPWQTLLFHPKPEDPTHPGRGTIGGTVPDHLIADLFWMPVVEPYPISQPFSTAGKINMNYQIEPFTYITRATGIYAVMKATKMMAMPLSIYGSNTYDPKPIYNLFAETQTKPAVPGKYRFPIDVDMTLTGFTQKFATDIFRSPTQISEINLVPQDGGSHSYNDMASFWQNNTATGDNLREKPYADIYPRLTTKSNAYMVHFRVQVLQKSPGTPVTQWVEKKDQVVSEYRGSSEIERYLDSTEPNLPDFANLIVTDPTSASLNLDNYYRYRVVSTKRFSPY